MKKIKLKKLKNYPFKILPVYEEQTKIKHLVFKDYFDTWVKMVGKYNKLNYIDGFGGPGAYRNKNKGKIYWGSPILAAEVIRENKIRLGRDINLIVVDKKRENIENIKSIFNYKKLNDIKPIFINNDFDEAINEILDKVRNIAPTFVFIDPFGFKVKYSTLEKIMSRPKCEILLNFMFNGINRFLSVSQIERVFTDLFGDTDWKKYKRSYGKFRERGLVECFREKLKQFSKFVIPYRISFSNKQRTYYYLFHLTNYWKGASIMKLSFAKYNYGRTEYRGRMQHQQTLFELGIVKDKEIESFLIDKYQGISKKYVEIIEENIDETRYLDKEIQKALRRLEEKGKIYIERFPKLTEKKKQPRTNIKEKDIVYFGIFPSVEPKRKSLLYKTKVEYGNFTINHIFGCAHGCNYPCYARMMAMRYGKIKDYEDWLHPKIVSNALELLDKEIPKYKNEIDFVHLCFSSDPFMYDKLNKRTYPQIKELTLRIIAKLNRYNIRCTVLTKGILPKELANVEKYGANNYYGITLVSLDKEFKEKFEPYSADYEDRINYLKFLHNKGLKTWVSIEPYPTPNLDKTQNLKKLLETVKFVDKIIFGKMNYNTHSSRFENNADFYEEKVEELIKFCKKHKIKYHIKHGTQREYNSSTETIFKED